MRPRNIVFAELAGEPHSMKNDAAV